MSSLSTIQSKDQTSVSLYSSDPGQWGKLDEKQRNYWISEGPAACRNNDGLFTASARMDGSKRRMISKDWFKCEMPNGEKVDRDWLIYSPSKGDVYCFMCLLFASSENAFTKGFNDWKHPERLRGHDTNDEHFKCVMTFITRQQTVGRVDSQLANDIIREEEYWRQVLKRVVAVVQFISERGLAFRGDDETIGSPNNGNFLGILEVIAKFDPFLEAHLEKHGNKGSGSTSYISKTTYEQIIHLMKQQVLSHIKQEIKNAKYFSIIVDSTPDVTHVDQLTYIFRYVNIAQTGEVVERFVGFDPFIGHKGNEIADAILRKVEELELDISNCRGQSYDNASNMSGKYQGVQAHMKRVNPLMDYIPCAAHSLNLVGVHSVDCCLDAVNFFGFLQSLYNFASASTSRWKVVMANIKDDKQKEVDKTAQKTAQKLTIKSLSTTRWSSNAAATNMVSQNYPAILKALKQLSTDEDQTADTRHDAEALHKQMLEMETAFMCVFWNALLTRINATSIQLQRSTIDLHTAVQLLRSLKDFVLSQRGDSQFESYEREAKVLCNNNTYKSEKTRLRKRRAFADEEGSPEAQTHVGSDKFRIETYYVVVDKLTACLQARTDSYADVYNTFGFLYELQELDDDTICTKAKQLISKYPKDLDFNLGNELLQFKSFTTTLSWSTSNKENPVQLIRQKNVQSGFQNVDIAYRIYLSIPITNCEGERSFSRLKLIKTPHRSTMTQERLNSLSVLAVESDVARELDFSGIIKQFAKDKARKKAF